MAIFSSKKSQSDIIDEIHNSFYSEADAILKDAKVETETETLSGEYKEEYRKLSAFGFIRSKNAKKIKSEESRIEKSRIEKAKHKELLDAVLYFKKKYPNYSFIPEESVIKICDRYGLVYGSVEYYTGFVPEKNLDEVDKFKIDKSDMAYIKTVRWAGLGMSESEAYINYKEYSKHSDNNYVYSDPLMTVIYDKAPLEIAAPISDFDTTGLKLDGKRLIKQAEAPDPIVMQPVLYNGKKHYIIITAWGKEASDPEVICDIPN